MSARQALVLLGEFVAVLLAGVVLWLFWVATP